jgi:predicted acyltransferase
LELLLRVLLLWLRVVFLGVLAARPLSYFFEIFAAENLRARHLVVVGVALLAQA